MDVIGVDVFIEGANVLFGVFGDGEDDVMIGEGLELEPFRGVFEVFDGGCC